MNEPLPYTIVIGLEVHVQLLTASKMFCGCSTRFGAPPNTQTCPVCIGMPGTLPVMNRRAFELALRAAAALNCDIPRFTKWDRKNYYYPDLPKGYQISQYDLPMSRDGRLTIHDPRNGIGPKDIGIIRAHLEEDAGKSMHDEAAGRADSRIDLNRAGTPLLEIVSQPDIRSPAEAKLFLTELKLLLNYLEVSDCNMQEGSLRVDANINLHIDTPQGKAATPIVEVKNMNSFRAVERALAYEAQRQYDQWRETGRTRENTPKSTRGWDEQRQATYLQRSKEESSDYRYFPDPDLAPVVVSQEQCQAVRQSLGELPADLRRRFQADYDLPHYDADVLVGQGRAVAAYFEALARACGDGKTASNWVQQDVLRALNERNIGIDQFPVPAAELGALIARVRRGEFTTSRAREILANALESQQSIDAVVARMGIVAVDDSELRDLCLRLLQNNPKIAAECRAGNVKGLGALVGQAKKLNPNVNPARVRELCEQLIAEQG